MRFHTGSWRDGRRRHIAGYLALRLLASCGFQSDGESDPQVTSRPTDAGPRVFKERALEDYALYEPRGAGCEREVLPAGLLIRPATWDAISCTLSAECPKVGCEATTAFLCRYPELEHTCESDTDCTGLPASSCVRQEERCFGFVACGKFDRFCTSPSLRSSCLSDVECHAAPGGKCERMITNTHCSVDRCYADADCGAGLRCVCAESSDRGFRGCLRANCLSDGDCASDQVCASTNWVQGAPVHHTCNGGDPAQFCTTAQDECGEGRRCPDETGGPDRAISKEFACGYDTQRERFACVECSWQIP